MLQVKDVVRRPQKDQVEASSSMGVAFTELTDAEFADAISASVDTDEDLDEESIVDVAFTEVTDTEATDTIIASAITDEEFTAQVEGMIMKCNGLPWAVVKGGRRVQFDSAPPANRIARTSIVVTSEWYNKVPFGGHFRQGGRVIGTHGQPACFVMSGLKWCTDCLELITDNGSNIDFVSGQEFSRFPNGPALRCNRANSDQAGEESRRDIATMMMQSNQLRYSHPHHRGNGLCVSMTSARGAGCNRHSCVGHGHSDATLQQCDATDRAQMWSYADNRLRSQLISGWCLTVDSSLDHGHCEPLTLAQCDSTNSRQHFVREQVGGSTVWRNTGASNLAIDSDSYRNSDNNWIWACPGTNTAKYFDMN